MYPAHPPQRRCAVQVLPWPVDMPIRFNVAAMSSRAGLREAVSLPDAMAVIRDAGSRSTLSRLVPALGSGALQT